ncbi:MAG: hypothetical protein HC831_15790 [Chloroflexia bacterium]|nr:hypothetical protein [Chloroflexia bacterium]
MLAANAREQFDKNATNAIRLAELSWKYSTSGLKSLALLRILNEVYYGRNRTPFCQNFETASGICSVGFINNNQQIITASWDGTIATWDVESGRQLMFFEPDTVGLNYLSVSPDETKAVVTTGLGADARVYDLKTGKRIFILKGHDFNVQLAIFSTDGSKIVTTGEDRTAKVWDVKTGHLINDFKTELPVKKIMFSKDGKYMYAVLEVGGVILKWNLKKGNAEKTIEAHPDLIPNAKFVNDEKQILTSSYDRTCKVIDIETGNELIVLKGHEYPVMDAAMSPDGNYIATAGYDGTFKLWDAKAQKEIYTKNAHTNWTTIIQFTPDGKKIITGSDDNTVKIWDTETGTLLHNLSGHTGSIESISVIDNGNKILTHSFGGSVKLWYINDEVYCKKLKGHTSSIYSAAFSPDGKKL